MRRWPIVVAAISGALPGCRRTNRILNTADRAPSVANSSTARSLTSIARSEDPEAALKAGLKRRGEV